MKKVGNGSVTDIVIAAVISLSTVAAACDDGILNTVVEKESLEDYLAAHPNLHLFMNGAHNFREPVFTCFYDEVGNRLNRVPRGKYDSEEGISYGKLTAVEIPETQRPVSLTVAFTTDGISDCVDPMPDFEVSSYLTFDVLFLDETDHLQITVFLGYLSQARGGENWGDICGDGGDEPCENYAGLGYSGNTLLENPPPAGKTALNFISPLTFGWQGLEEMTLCWDPDDGGAEPAILLTTLPEEYDPNRSGWPDFPPITTGTIHLQSGHVDCETASISAALATLAMPADMTFGPAGGKVAFGPDTSGHIYILGTNLEGVPAEAGLRIIPILNP